MPRQTCGFIPPTTGFAPCTRNTGHEGPCAHPKLPEVHINAPWAVSDGDMEIIARLAAAAQQQLSRKPKVRSWHRLTRWCPTRPFNHWNDH